MEAMWNEWLNSHTLIGAVIGAFLGAFLAVFINGVFVPLLWRRTTGEAKREREERKKQARKRELLHLLRERSADNPEAGAESLPTTRELDGHLGRKKKLRTKSLLDTYELLRELEAEERVRPVRGAAAPGYPDIGDMRWSYVFFRESPSVRGGGIETNQLVQQLFHIKKQAKVLEERMAAFDRLKQAVDQIRETLERLEEQGQRDGLRELLEELNEKLDRQAASLGLSIQRSTEAGAENGAKDRREVT